MFRTMIIIRNWIDSKFTRWRQFPYSDIIYRINQYINLGSEFAFGFAGNCFLEGTHVLYSGI